MARSKISSNFGKIEVFLFVGIGKKLKTTQKVKFATGVTVNISSHFLCVTF